MKTTGNLWQALERAHPEEAEALHEVQQRLEAAVLNDDQAWCAAHRAGKTLDPAVVREVEQAWDSVLVTCARLCTALDVGPDVCIVLPQEQARHD